MLRLRPMPPHQLLRSELIREAVLLEAKARQLRAMANQVPAPRQAAPQRVVRRVRLSPEQVRRLPPPR